MAKYAHDTIVPFKDSRESKKQQVAHMFDNIAFRYDFLNRFLSVGIDVSWRKKAINLLKDVNPRQILDVATGTGDVAILAHKMLKPEKITGIDISEGMLAIGRKKILERNLESRIELIKEDVEAIAFDNDSFDAVTVAFGVRNFQNLEQGFRQMYRVLKPGGKLVVLEFSKPGNIIVKAFYTFYMNGIAPFFGKIFARNREAYQYLNDSVQKFPEGEKFVSIMEKCGYSGTGFKALSLGICSVYWGKKVRSEQIPPV